MSPLPLDGDVKSSAFWQVNEGRPLDEVMVTAGSKVATKDKGFQLRLLEWSISIEPLSEDNVLSADEPVIESQAKSRSPDSHR